MFCVIRKTGYAVKLIIYVWKYAKVHTAGSVVLSRAIRDMTLVLIFSLM